MRKGRLLPVGVRNEMRLEECYQKLGGDLDEVLARLKKEERIHRLIKKIPEDVTMQQLREALEGKDYEEAFRYAHNLKGMCVNLGLVDLGHAASVLTECLRGGVPKENPQPMMLEVERYYTVAVEAISSLEP